MSYFFIQILDEYKVRIYQPSPNIVFEIVVFKILCNALKLHISLVCAVTFYTLSLTKVGSLLVLLVEKKDMIMTDFKDSIKIRKAMCCFITVLLLPFSR